MSYKLAGVNWNDDGTMATKELTPLNALEKIDHTICLNINKGTLTFGLDKYDNCDCENMKEFCKCYDAIEKALKALEVIKKVVKYDIEVNGNDIFDIEYVPNENE